MLVPGQVLQGSTGYWSQVKLSEGWPEDGVSRGLGLPLYIACQHPPGGAGTVPTSQTQPADAQSVLHSFLIRV